jgi:hypothetical protein
VGRYWPTLDEWKVVFVWYARYPIPFSVVNTHLPSFFLFLSRDKDRRQKARQRAKTKGSCDEDAVAERRYVITGEIYRGHGMLLAAILRVTIPWYILIECASMTYVQSHIPVFPCPLEHICPFSSCSFQGRRNADEKPSNVLGLVVIKMLLPKEGTL